VDRSRAGRAQQRHRVRHRISDGAVRVHPSESVLHLRLRGEHPLMATHSGAEFADPGQRRAVTGCAIGELESRAPESMGTGGCLWSFAQADY
jgi:hypothetical protein